MVKSRQDNHGKHLEVESYIFDIVYNFKYLGQTINNENNNHNEIVTRSTAASKCYHGLANIFK